MAIKKLVNKYNPTTIDDFSCSDDIKSFIKDECIAKNNIPDILLSGSPGIGKTTLAKIIVKSIECDYIYINASDERSMDVMRDKVKGFACTAGFNPLKIVILDEADYIRQDAQAMLRNIIETYSESTRFIMTCNYPERLIPALHSRFKEIKIPHLTKVELANLVVDILDKEEVEYDLLDVKHIITKHHPDIRKTINEISGCIVSNKLVLNDLFDVSNSYKEILNELKKPNYQSFNIIRQIIANNGTQDIDNMYRFLFNNMKEFCPESKWGEITEILAEMNYQSNFKVDKEINVMSTISQIINKLK